MNRAPILTRRIQGTKRYCWRICPYASNDTSGRIPNGERAVHPVTSGAMSMDIRDGHDGVGWRCDDDNCPYFKGLATTAVTVTTQECSINYSTGEYTYTPKVIELPVGCSGTRFWEK